MPTTRNMPLLEMYLSYDQWKEEHDQLHERLLELCRFMRVNPDNVKDADWETHHGVVRQLFLPFMEDWRRHLEKERQTIFPLALAASGAGRMRQAAVLEQDGQLALRYYGDYLEALESGTTPEDALSRLLQVLMIIAEHFRVEDETVLPLTERLMEEIAYSGS